MLERWVWSSAVTPQAAFLAFDMGSTSLKKEQLEMKCAHIADITWQLREQFGRLTDGPKYDQFIYVYSVFYERFTTVEIVHSWAMGMFAPIITKGHRELAVTESTNCQDMRLKVLFQASSELRIDRWMLETAAIFTWRKDLCLFRSQDISVILSRPRPSFETL